jgi:uncharacterized protein YhdP
VKNIKRFFRIARYALFVSLIATAVGLSLIRFWLLPRAAQWREELQAGLSEMVGETVHISSLAAGMNGFHPLITLRGFKIDNATGAGPALEFERLGVGLDSTASLLAKKPVIDRIDLDGGRLRLIRQADGSISVAG